MVENAVKEWLSEFSTLEKDDWATFAITTSQNKILIDSIYAVLDDVHKYSKVNLITRKYVIGTNIIYFFLFIDNNLIRYNLDTLDIPTLFFIKL